MSMKKVDEDFNVEIKELPIDLLVENKGQIPECRRIRGRYQSVGLRS